MHYYINKYFYKNGNFLLYHDEEDAVINLNVLNLQISRFFFKQHLLN